MSISNNIIVNESGTATHIENYKIVILGDQYVGKTSILNKYKYESVEPGYAVKLYNLANCWDRFRHKKCFSGRQDYQVDNVGHSWK
jgi:GTPase SAR1 family protein